MASNCRFEEKRDLARNLFSAIEQNDDEKVLELLNMKADPNYIMNDLINGRTTAIHSAVLGNKPSIVKLLLEFGADVNLADEDGDTPFSSSLTESCSQSIRDLLCKYGADRNMRNLAGISPLLKMFENRQLYNDKFEYTTLVDLLNHCDDLHQMNSHGQSLIHLVALVHPHEEGGIIDADRHHCRDYLQWLSVRGVSVGLLDFDGQSPLHKAASACCFEAVQFLIDSGCNATTRDLQGKSALHCLGLNPHRLGFKKILKLLLCKGCNIDESDCMGRTLLHYVTSSNGTCNSAVTAVLEMEANPRLQDKCGLNSLHFCVLPSVFTENAEEEEYEANKTSVSDVVEMLVRHGVDINSCDYDGFTPLHYAVRQKKLKLIESLILLGSNPNIRTKTGETAIHRSTIHAEILEVVLQTIYDLGKTVDLNAKDIFGSTPLHWAVNFVTPGSVRMLLKKNCEHCADECGRTPADLACFLYLTCLYEDLGILYQRGVYPMHDPVCVSARRDQMHDFIKYVVYKGIENSSCSFSSQDLSDADSLIKIINESMCEDDFDLDQMNEDSVYSVSEKPNKCPEKDDMFVDCPLLQTIYNEDREILMLSWRIHLINHKESLSKYVRMTLDSSDMGLQKETQENIDIASQISDLITATAEEVGRLHPLLKCEIRPAGSWNEGTKIGYQNEFDFSWILISFNDAFIPNESSLFPPEYVQIRLKDGTDNEPFMQYVDSDKVLDVRKIIRDLYAAINDVLIKQKDGCLTKYIYLRKFLNINKGSIDKLSVRWVGGFLYKDILIDIDIVPVIIPSHWIPTQIKVNSRLLEKMNHSFSIVLKTPDSRFVRNWQTFLRIDVAHLEAWIIKNIPGPVRKGYILVKALLDSPYMPQIYDKDNTDYYLKRFLTTYMLKTCFLHELEEAKVVENAIITSDEDPKSVAVDWATRIVFHLKKSLDECILPSFFAPEVNLLVKDSRMVVHKQYMMEAECDCLVHLLEVGAFEIVNELNSL